MTGKKCGSLKKHSEALSVFARSVRFLESQTDRSLSKSGQTSVCIVVELMSDFMETTKGLLKIKSASKLTQSLSSVRTAGIHVGVGRID